MGMLKKLKKLKEEMVLILNPQKKEELKVDKKIILDQNPKIIKV